MLPRRIVLISAPHILDHPLQLHFLAACLALKITPPGALCQAGIEVNLQLGVRQHHGADIPPDHHHAATFADASLLDAHRLAHAEIRRHGRYGLLDLGPPDVPGEVLAVGQHGNVAAIVKGG